MPFFIRLFDQDDRDFVLGLLPRLSGMDLPPWLTKTALDDFNQAAMQKAMDDMPADAALLIAVDECTVASGVHLPDNRVGLFYRRKAGLYF